MTDFVTARLEMIASMPTDGHASVVMQALAREALAGSGELLDQLVNPARQDTPTYEPGAALPGTAIAGVVEEPSTPAPEGGEAA